MRRGRKPKTFYRKRRQFRGRRIRRKNRMLIHYFKRTYVRTQVITNAGFVPVYSNPGATIYNQYRLSDMPNYQDFTDLYDTYKICGIREKFVFEHNSSEIGSDEVPNLLTCNDFNDVTAPASENEMLEYSSFKVSRMDKPIKRYFRPTCSSTTSGVARFIKSTWIPTSVSANIHCGLKIAVNTNDTATGTTFGTVKIYTTYYIACRTPR